MPSPLGEEEDAKVGQLRALCAGPLEAGEYDAEDFAGGTPMTACVVSPSGRAL